MATAGIIAFVVLLIAVPIFVVKRDLVARRVRHRHRRSAVSLPFLFFPTRNESDAPPVVPAWNGRNGGLPPSRRPATVTPEPGLADLPPKPRAAGEVEAAVRDTRSRRGGTDRRANPNSEQKSP